ncbi:uncharacterized protein LOC108246785 [Kryptolebias marmoratus]|uniref:uncharacterized protein LOC108246785 n=1 Tax=Kryptolebias marmoratus TaxID=37003 RepID=UPI0007F9366A|nr:uncharacterized protein LOC108246785 [Kryptolebias marmoratus]
MDQTNLWFVLLLPLCLCLDTKENVLKTVGRDPDFTPLCSNVTLSLITEVVCRIETKGISEGRGGCRLLYSSTDASQRECDSRFSLKTENQTVYLHLTGLTPEDSGSYTCKCSHHNGTNTLHLQVTVEDASSVSPLTRLSLTAVISTATGFIIVTGVLLGLILRKKHFSFRCHKQSRKFEISEKQDGLYESLQQPSDDLYQTTSSGRHHRINTRMINSVRKALRTPSANREQTDEVYENT